MMTIRISLLPRCLVSQVRRVPWSVIAVLPLIIMFKLSLTSLSGPWTFRKLKSSELDTYPPFESDLLTDFPADGPDYDSPRIPNIIHQATTQCTTEIRPGYGKYIQSFVYHNPDWDYYFWTNSSARQLIKERHPYLLNVWDFHGNSRFRLSVIKYVVLYEFGGVFPDIDMEALRPLHRATLKYACVIPPEPFEHSVFCNKVPFLLSNAFMMCRAKHPFFEHILQNLVPFASMAEATDASGTTFLTSQFMMYNNFPPGVYFQDDFTMSDMTSYLYNGNVSAVQGDAVYIPYTNFFMNIHQDIQVPAVRHFYTTCNDFDNLDTIYKRACAMLYRREFLPNLRFEYTKHHRYQPYFRFHKLFYTLFDGYHISEIVPNYRTFGK